MIVWDPSANKKLGAISLRSAFMMCCSFEQTEGDIVCCAGLDNCIDLYSLNNNLPSTRRVSTESGGLLSLVGHEKFVSCCKFLNNGKQLLSASADKTCILWDVENEKIMKQFEGHGYAHVHPKEYLEGDVMSLEISPINPNVFVTGSVDRTARLWDIRSGEYTHCFSGHNSDIDCVKFLPNGHSFVTASDDASCKIFDIRAYKEINSFSTEYNSSGCTAVDLSKSGRIIFSVFSQPDTGTSGEGHLNQLVAYDSCCADENSKAFIISRGIRIGGLAVNRSNGGTALCTGSWDNKIRLYS